MKISDLFVMGIKNLSRRKARTILTVLGVVIGSLSVIIMISVGYGMNNYFKTQIMQRGSLTMINIYKNGNNGEESALNDHLIDQLKALEHVKAVSPVIRADAQLFSGRYQTWLGIMAMDSSTFEAFDFPALQYGKYPSKEDMTPIVFGFSQPWGFYDPYSRGGNQIQIDLQKKKVVFKFIPQYQLAPNKKEFSMPLKNIAKMVETKGEYDGSVYMDINYYKMLYKQYCNTLTMEDRKKSLKTLSSYTEVMLNVDNINNVEGVQKQIEEMGYFSYSRMQDLIPLQEASKTLQVVLGAIGAVTMIASAISIANTMIMSIYERTKEIGVMKVLGCTVRDIRKLFLLEAAVIGLIGGIIGIGFGYIASFAINKFGGPIFQALMQGNYMYDMMSSNFSIIPIYLPFASLGISICVGVFSGYFPARRATKIRAIEAMKTDG